jgi:hypothetical protein
MLRLQDKIVLDIASAIAKEVIGLPFPPIEWVKVDRDSYGYNAKWKMGETTVWGHGLKSPDEIPSERLDCLVRGFYTDEVAGRLPEPYRSAPHVASSPEYFLARRIIDETMRLLFVAKRVK